jgi:hypothetical protein
MRRALSGGSDAAYVYACGITKSGFMPGARSSLSALPAPLRPDEHVAATPTPAAATPTCTATATTTATATPTCTATATPTFATTPTPSRSGHAWAPRSEVAVGRRRRVDDDDGRRRGPLRRCRHRKREDRSRKQRREDAGLHDIKPPVSPSPIDPILERPLMQAHRVINR